MSFKIFAAGRGDFHYSKDGCIDGDEFETIKTLAILQNMKATKLDVVDTTRDKYLSKDMTDLTLSIASMEFLHLLSESVDFLALLPGGDDAKITLSARQTHLLWPDTVQNSSYNFYPGDNPGAEFVKSISFALKETDLNNWGVLLALMIVLTKYYEHIQDKGVAPWINIQLTK